MILTDGASNSGVIGVAGCAVAVQWFFKRHTGERCGVLKLGQRGRYVAWQHSAVDIFNSASGCGDQKLLTLQSGAVFSIREAVLENVVNPLLQQRRN